MASFKPSLAFSLNCAIRIYPNPSLSSYLTVWRSIISRVISSSIGSSPALTMVMFIGSPGFPRICSTASLRVAPNKDLPSISVIKSPAWIPALLAGVLSIGEITFTKPSSIVTSMPKPPYSPRLFSCRSRKLLGLI